MRELAEEGRCSDDDIDTIDALVDLLTGNAHDKLGTTYQSQRLSVHHPYGNECASRSWPSGRACRWPRSLYINKATQGSSRVMAYQPEIAQKRQGS